MQCEFCNSVYHRSPWRRWRRARGVRFAEFWYCRPTCFELALAEILRRENAAPLRPASTPHRIPLGLQLLSRQQLTAAQLRAALATQREAGQGKIGEWLQRLGFATEAEITAALARQWSCPVLRKSPGNLGRNVFLPIPVLLLELFQMIPVEFAAATGTLLVAFSEGVDHSVLYAIEQMLGYRTEACLVSPSTLRRDLETLAQQRGAGDVVFDRMDDATECARVIASYASRVSAEKVRLARCGRHLWIRLERPSGEPLNLVLRSPQASYSLALSSST